MYEIKQLPQDQQWINQFHLHGHTANSLLNNVCKLHWADKTITEKWLNTVTYSAIFRYARVFTEKLIHQDFLPPSNYTYLWNNFGPQTISAPSILILSHNVFFNPPNWLTLHRPTYLFAAIPPICPAHPNPVNFSLQYSMKNRLNASLSTTCKGKNGKVGTLTTALRHEDLGGNYRSSSFFFLRH